MRHTNGRPSAELLDQAPGPDFSDRSEGSE